MPEPDHLNWVSIFLAVVSGGLVSTLLDHLVAAFKSSRSQRKSAKDIVDAHLDPLLKAADEISGKTISLAGRDFAPLAIQGNEALPSNDLIGLAYLYAKFWGRIEILERESIGVSLATDSRGRKLTQFLSCLGSQQVRLTNRTHQKAIGELTTEVAATGSLRTIGVVEFGRKITDDPVAKRWCGPLTDLLGSSFTKATRQQLLLYGVVLHALVDTLDPDHHSTHRRPSYENKLTKETKQRIVHLVFKTYLDGTGAVNAYTGNE